MRVLVLATLTSTKRIFRSPNVDPARNHAMFQNVLPDYIFFVLLDSLWHPKQLEFQLREVLMKSSFHVWKLWTGDQYRIPKSICKILFFLHGDLQWARACGVTCRVSASTRFWVVVNGNTSFLENSGTEICFGPSSISNLFSRILLQLASLKQCPFLGSVTKLSQNFPICTNFFYPFIPIFSKNLRFNAIGIFAAENSIMIHLFCSSVNILRYLNRHLVKFHRHFLYTGN